MSEIRINGNFWVGILVMAALFLGLFFLAKGLFVILSWIAPVLLIATAVLRYQVFLDFGKALYKLLKHQPIFGIAAIILSIVGLPFLSLALFGKALLDRRIIKFQRDQEKSVRGELVDYEEMDLPQQEKQRTSPADTDYDQLIK